MIISNLRPIKALISQQALLNNLALVKSIAPHSQLVCVIKANAYGHGMLNVAQILQSQSDYFSVARLHEALELREQGIHLPIVLLEGVFSIDEYQLCLQKQLVPVINSWNQIEQLREFYQLTAQEKRVKKLCYWLKIDTGMHRLGLSYNQLTQLYEKIPNWFRGNSPQTIMSHFACADEPEHDLNSVQKKQFAQVIKYFESELEPESEITYSMANSAAIIAFPETHFDQVRPGIMLYGVTPFAQNIMLENSQIQSLVKQLLPVMTLSSKIIDIKSIAQGECVGYGSRWCCAKNTILAVVAIGYGDGYPRHANNGTPVLVHGREVPLVGRVSMDMITIDVTRLIEQNIEVKIGDDVILWGNGLPIEHVAEKSGTIAYELLCQITSRVSFEYE